MENKNNKLIKVSPYNEIEVIKAFENGPKYIKSVTVSVPIINSNKNWDIESLIKYIEGNYLFLAGK